MPSYLKNDVVLVRYPFSDFSDTKIRPAVVVNAPHPSQDVFLVPLTSKTKSLLEGEFILHGWQQAGLNVESAVKRGVYTIQEHLILKRVGKLNNADVINLAKSLREWLGL